MLSLRLLKAAEFVSKDDTVLDVGTDHGYLPIYLVKNNLCKKAYASDVSINALNVAIDNIKKNNLDIKTFVSDGLKKIDVFFDTLIICGMGTHTILNIIDSDKTPDKLIIASNNDLYLLRSEIIKKGYKIEKESSVKDHKKYYDIILFTKGNSNISEMELKYGISDNKDYYKYLYQKTLDIYKVSNNECLLEDIEYLKNKSI